MTRWNDKLNAMSSEERKQLILGTIGRSIGKYITYRVWRRAGAPKWAAWQGVVAIAYLEKIAENTKPLLESSERLERIREREQNPPFIVPGMDWMSSFGQPDRIFMMEPDGTATELDLRTGEPIKPQEGDLKPVDIDFGGLTRKQQAERAHRRKGKKEEHDRLEADGWKQGKDKLWRNDRFGGSFNIDNALKRIGSKNGGETSD